MELQVIFLADRFSVRDGHLEHKVELVVGDVVLDVAVFDDADESGDLGIGTKFLGDLANQRHLDTLAGLDVSAGQK